MIGNTECTLESIVRMYAQENWVFLSPHEGGLCGLAYAWASFLMEYSKDVDLQNFHEATLEAL